MLLFKATVCYYFILWSCWNQLQIETQTLFWSSESRCCSWSVCVTLMWGRGPIWTGVSRGRPSSRIIDMLSVCLSSGPTITQRSDPCVCVCAGASGASAASRKPLSSADTSGCPTSANPSARAANQSRWINWLTGWN